MTTSAMPERPLIEVKPALNIEGLTVGYGGVPAVRDLNAQVRAGEILALLGPNGAGKTTTLLASVGALPALSGIITALGEPLDRRVEANARRGVILVPDSRGVFHRLSVDDNLRLARRKHGPSVDDVFDYFPALRSMRSRRCGTLSGGEQQMLALAKALLCAPKILLVDELSLGLSPIAVEGLLPGCVRSPTTSTWPWCWSNNTSNWRCPSPIRPSCSITAGPYCPAPRLSSVVAEIWSRRPTSVMPKVDTATNGTWDSIEEEGWPEPGTLIAARRRPRAAAPAIARATRYSWMRHAR